MPEEEPSSVSKSDESQLMGESKPEVRTRESEIKTNIEFWKDLSVDVDEADVRAKIGELPEVKEATYLYFPEGIKFSDISKKMGDFCERKVLEYQKGELRTMAPYPGYTIHSEVLDGLEMPRKTEESYAIAVNLSTETEFIKKSSTDWLAENGAEASITPLEYIIATLRYFENGLKNQQRAFFDISERAMTIFPGSRTNKERVPALTLRNNIESITLEGDSLDENEVPSSTNVGFIGKVFRVIAKDTKVE